MNAASDTRAHHQAPTVTIRHRWTHAVLYTHATNAERLASGLAMRDALEAACAADANLADANLADANLADAYLADAYLAGANLAGANLTRANLRGANLADANLAGANLAEANLADAKLKGANLTGAKWRNITISRAPLQISIPGEWAIFILDDHMQIGCELHALAEWREFDDATIVAMDGRHALTFWRKYRHALLAMAESDGRGVVQQRAAEAHQ